MASLAAGPDEIIRAIREMDEDFVRAIAARDTAGLVDRYYAEDARVLPPRHPIVEGREAIKHFWDRLIEAGLGGLALDTTHVEVSGNLAYAIGQYTMAVEPRGGTGTKGKYVVVYRRQDSTKWRAVVGMFSSDER